MTTTQTNSAPAASRDAAARAGPLPRVVYVLAAGIFLLGTTEFMIAGLLPLMAGDLHVSTSRAGLLISGFALGMVVGAPAMAALTLRLPARTTLTAALAVFAAGHVLVAVSSSFTVVLTARIVTAVATGAFWAVASVTVSNAAGPANRAKALGVMVSGLTVANVIGVPLGALVGQTLGWRAPFIILAALSAAAIAGIAAFVPHQRGQSHPARLRTELTAFRDRRLWLLLLVAAFAEAGVFAAFSYVSFLLTGPAGLPQAAVPAVLAAFGAGALVGSLTGGRLGDNHFRLAMTAGLTGTTVVLTALALIARFPLAAIGLTALLGITGFTITAPLTGRVLALAGQAPTLASATATAAFNVGNATGPWLGGIALGLSSTFFAPAGVGAVLGLFALGTWITFRSIDAPLREVDPLPGPHEAKTSAHLGQRV